MTNTRYHFLNTTAIDKPMREAACVNHTGKMSGMISWSTNPVDNARCKARAACGNDKCVCTVCYSNAMVDMYDALSAKLTINSNVFTSELMQGVEFPTINPDRHPGARIEAFGDLMNDVQAMNYIALIDINYNVTFGWWTKNPDIIADAIAQLGYFPDNVNVIYSNPIMDTRADLASLQRKYPFIKKVFNVWTSEAAAEAAGVTINCGSKKCRGCMLCYSDNDIEEINELKK